MLVDHFGGWSRVPLRRNGFTPWWRSSCVAPATAHPSGRGTNRPHLGRSAIHLRHWAPMTAPTAGRDQPDDSMRGSLHICVTAIVAGVLIGVVGGAFRWCLQTADALRIELVDWAHTLPGPGWLVPIVTTAAGATLAALIVRWEPLAAGSGIQHVEAAFRGDARPPLLRVLPTKFVGGVLSIGSGLVLGREGP